MFRLLGFCLGSAVSIALLVFFVGVPELELDTEDRDTARFDAAVEKLKARQEADRDAATRGGSRSADPGSGQTVADAAATAPGSRQPGADDDRTDSEAQPPGADGGDGVGIEPGSRLAGDNVAGVESAEPGESVAAALRAEPPAAPPEPAILPPTAAPGPAADPEWHEIWTPFRSRIAARGFVGRLEAVTGLDYRITRLDSGHYQVAVAYRDAVELDGKLSQISAATGLDVAGPLP